jgi:hypothetical protein
MLFILPIVGWKALKVLFIAKVKIGTYFKCCILIRRKEKWE